MNTTLKPKVFVMMSGGVDSSVAAALLKERGFDVVGIHMKMWAPSESEKGGTDSLFDVCRQQHQDRLDATRVAAHLAIPFATWDVTREYQQAVVECMIAEYAAGRTPNPDIMCNREIKFGVFLRRALEAGADFVATGHYARLARDERHERDGRNENAPRLLAARDANKDQSYFLWTLTSRQLARSLFPIGDYLKSEVREMARQRRIITADKKDSQGVCFIGPINMSAFLKKRIPARPGAIMTTAGKHIGEHEGLAFYTMGQRHGIAIGGGIPYYVAAKNEKKNTLVVAQGPYDEKLFSSELKVSGANWISGMEPKLPLKCEARIRYRQPLQRCTILKQTRAGAWMVLFADPQRAVTPGQSVVFYREDEVIGGGIIAP